MPEEIACRDRNAPSAVPACRVDKPVKTRKVEEEEMTVKVTVFCPVPGTARDRYPGREAGHRHGPCRPGQGHRTEEQGRLRCDL